MKPLHITRTVFDVTVCEIRGVRLRVPLRAGASACTSEWHSSAPSTTTTLPRAVSLSPGSLVVHDHPSAPVIRWFQTVALTSRCGSFWKVLFGVMWETGTWGRVSVGRCVCVCTAENIANMFCPFQTVCCLSSVLVACQPQRIRSHVLTLQQRPIRLKGSQRLTPLGHSYSIIDWDYHGPWINYESIWHNRAQAPTSDRLNAFKSSATVTILALKRVKITSFTIDFGCWGFRRLGLRNRSSMEPSFTFTFRFFHSI